MKETHGLSSSATGGGGTTCTGLTSRSSRYRIRQKKHYSFHNCFPPLRSICCDGQSQSQISHAGGGGGGGGGVSGIEASEATSAAVLAEQHLGPATTVNGSLAPPQMV